MTGIILAGLIGFLLGLIAVVALPCVVTIKGTPISGLYAEYDTKMYKLVEVKHENNK